MLNSVNSNSMKQIDLHYLTMYLFFCFPSYIHQISNSMFLSIYLQTVTTWKHEVPLHFRSGFSTFKMARWLHAARLCCMTSISKAHIVWHVHIKQTSCVRLPSSAARREARERRNAAAMRRLSCGVLARLSIKCQRALIDDCLSSGLGLIWR